MNIRNKTILITGASSGIGRSIALQLAKHDVNLVLLGRDEVKLQGVKELVEAQGSRAFTFAFDITNSAELDVTVESIKKATQIDIIINNAGVWHNSTQLGELAPAMIETVVATNLTSQMLLTRHFISDMKDRESAIINIISRAGMEGKSGRTAYAASKYGLRGFTDALRDETYGDPIRIGAVFQAGTNTEMFQKAGEEMPTDKYSEPEDLADVIIFMLTRPAKIWLNEVHVTY